MDLLLMALATASITLTLTKAKVTLRARAWLAYQRGPLGWLGKMLQCTYCTSHWVAGTLVVVSDHAFHPLRIMAVVTLASPLAWMTYKAHAGIAKETT